MAFQITKRACFVNSIFFPSSALLLGCIGQLVTFLISMFGPIQFVAVFVIFFSMLCGSELCYFSDTRGQTFRYCYFRFHLRCLYSDSKNVRRPNAMLNICCFLELIDIILIPQGISGSPHGKRPADGNFDADWALVMRKKWPSCKR